MKRFLFLMLAQASAFATMSASFSGWLPVTVFQNPVIRVNQPVQAQFTLGNSSGSSVNIISVRGVAYEQGDNGLGASLSKTVNFGNVCLTGAGGVTGNCNNVVPANSGNGGSLVINLPLVFGAPSTFPPYVGSPAPQVNEFGTGNNLTYGFGGSSTLSTNGKYVINAVFQGSDGSYFTSGGSTITVQAVPMPDAY